MPSLRRLQLRDNLIESLPTFPEGSSLLCELQYLDLGKNHISFLPTSFIMSMCS
ncbi:MAG: leucine-rich repeat domain-containing protein [bacterium]